MSSEKNYFNGNINVFLPKAYELLYIFLRLGLMCVFHIAGIVHAKQKVFFLEFL